MAANHEDILYAVEQYNLWSGKVSKIWLFRTRQKARNFKRKKGLANKRNDRVFRIQKAEWGPDNV